MLDFFSSFALAFHLICMNIAAAGPLVCVWLDWRSASGNEVACRAAKFLAYKSLAMLIVGTVFGIFVAVFLWNDAYHDLMHAFMYKIKWGAWELLFSLMLMILYAVLVARGAPRHLFSKLGRASIAVLAGTNLLYHFPVLFIVISEVAGGYLQVPEKVDAAIFRSLMTDSSVLARSVHFWVASFAVTGVSLISYGKWLLRNEDQQETGSRIAVWGARIALLPTLLQILVGVWVLSVLPPSMQQRLMGSDLLATGTFGLSIVGALWLMHHLSAVAFGETRPRTLKLAIHLMYAVVILMTYTSRLALAKPLHAHTAATWETSNDR
ncbi:MAG: hypothetical protein O3C40_30470 [Planctomycetota bacterium]|nr:hypothetical protein [Planctomycetota bacterium]